MSPQSDRPRQRSLLARVWPDLLVTLLAVAAAGAGALGRVLPLLLVVPVWAGAAVAAVVGLLSRQTPGDHRQVRLLLVAVCAAHAVAGFASVALGGRTGFAAAPIFTFGVAAIVVAKAAARVPGWWPSLALAAAAVALETARVALAAAGLAPAAGAGGWAVCATGGALLVLLAFTAAADAARTRRAHADLQTVVQEHRRLRDEAEVLRASGSENPVLEERDLTPEGKTIRTMSAVVDFDRDLDRILGLAALAVGARSVVLFLLGEDGERLCVRRAREGEGTAIDHAATPRLGEGVVGHVARTRRPALFTNLSPGTLRPALYRDGTAVVSLAAVPLSEAGVFRGVLLADAGQAGAFTREHERLLGGFAAQVGTLLETVRSDARRERHGHRLETLRFVSQALSSTLKIDDLLAKMVELSQRIVGYDRCALFIHDPASRTLVVRAQRGFFPDGADQVRIPFDHGLAGYIALHRRAMLYSNLKDLNRSVDIIPGAPGQERIRSFLGVPVGGQEGPLGVWVLAADEPGRFNAEHLDVLSVVAAQAGSLIANAVLHQTVERLAVTDGLTGLYNHRRFQEQLQHELERGDRHHEPVSLLLLDIDHFKRINDTHGHPFGDQVLRGLAAELMRLARRVDFVARYGGEEFAIVLVNTDRRGCRVSAQRVLKAVRALRLPHEGGAFSFTLSIGSATCPEDARTREQIIRCADRALYAAKDGGRDRAVVFPEVGGEWPPGAPEPGFRGRVAAR